MLLEEFEEFLQGLGFGFGVHGIGSGAWDCVRVDGKHAPTVIVEFV